MTKPALKFRADKTFTIAQLTDLHLHDKDENASARTLALAGAIVDAERPDLAIMTGDVVAGRECRDPAASFMRAAAVMEERRIPWAAVFGNHDDEGGCSRAELMAAQQQCAYCLSEPGPEGLAGVGNYVVTIQASAGTGAGAGAAAILYLLDSLSYAPETLKGYAWIEPAHCMVRETAKSLGQDLPTRLPALAFFHIPLPEYNFAWEHGVRQGDKFENVCAPALNSGLFVSLLEIGDVLGTFVGHDHTNDYDAEVLGIRLCYGRSGGFGTYGREGFSRGARLIRLTEGERTFETWIRTEDGQTIGRGKGPARLCDPLGKKCG